MEEIIKLNKEKSDKEFEKLLSQDLGERKFKEGEITTGTVSEIGKKFIFVDLGLKSEGAIPIDEFKFALHLNYNENLNTGINIVKSINGFDLKFNIDADIDNNNQNSNIFINKSY